MDAAKLQLGQIITTEQQRDAVHIAVAPVEAATRLLPGYPVELDASGRAVMAKERGIGVVDPFLEIGVPKGGRFWLFLYPGSITGLRHEWSHPAFDGRAENPMDEKAKSEAYLQSLATLCGVDYERMMDCMDEDDYISMGDNEHYKQVLPEAEVLEKHFENVRGHKPKSTYVFSCAC